jgi:hypothetical protein
VVASVLSRLVVATILEACPKLSSLDLNFKVANNHAILVLLPDLLKLRCHWLNLKTLKLRGLVSPQDKLIKCLLDHSETLRDLKLKNIGLHYDRSLGREQTNMGHRL